MKSIANPRVQTWFAGVSLVLWAVMSPIALASGLKSSLVFISIMSLFANVATCFGWWVGSLVNVKADTINVSNDSAKVQRDAADAQRDAMSAQVERMEEDHGSMLAAMHAMVVEVHAKTCPESP